MPLLTLRSGAALVVTAALALTACSTGPSGGAGSPSTTGRATPDTGATTTSTGDAGAATTAPGDAGAATTGSAGGAMGTPAGNAGTPDTGSFPVTIEHAFGSTTIESDPQRVATVGWTDQDVVVALGETPIGATKITWGGNAAGSTDYFDAALGEVGAAPGDVTRYDDSDGIPIDEIAALDPDLILGTNSGMTQEEYDSLSKLAPVVAYPELAWGTPWEDSLALVGDAIGRPDQAAATLTQTDTAIDGAVAEYPDLAGTSVAWAFFTPTDLSTVGIYTSHDLRPQMLRRFGMVDAEVVTRLTEGNKSFSGNLSAEQADTLDAEVLVFYVTDPAEEQALLADPLLSTIPALKSGAYVASADNAMALPLSSPSPLSIPVALEGFLPLLGEAASKAS